MNRIPYSTLALLLVSFLMACQTGCRNRCSQPCGGGGGLFAHNTTVAPAPTYSLNIPSVARNQPYYAPNGGPISTTARAPVPVGTQPAAGSNSISNSNSNLQWRQQGTSGTSNSGSTFGSQPAQSASGTRLVETNTGRLPVLRSPILETSQPLKPTNALTQLVSPSLTRLVFEQRLKPSSDPVSKLLSIKLNLRRPSLLPPLELNPFIRLTLWLRRTNHTTSIQT